MKANFHLKWQLVKFKMNWSHTEIVMPDGPYTTTAVFPRSVKYVDLTICSIIEVICCITGGIVLVAVPGT
jgi:hypothetical protein